MAYPRIAKGERAIMAGCTGSGKSTLAKWLLTRSDGRWIILNPKHTAAYKTLENSVVVNGLNTKLVDEYLTQRRNPPRFIVVNPDSSEADADLMDDFIMWLHQSWRNVSLCCDELYTLHKGAHAGKGLIGWLTRGRELNQSFLGLTQRPAWLSQFLFSESDYIGTMKLRLPADKKKFVDMTNQRIFANDLEDRHWLWYDTAKDDVRYLAPIPIS